MTIRPTTLNRIAAKNQEPGVLRERDPEEVETGSHVQAEHRQGGHLPVAVAEHGRLVEDRNSAIRANAIVASARYMPCSLMAGPAMIMPIGTANAAAMSRLSALPLKPHSTMAKRAAADQGDLRQADLVGPPGQRHQRQHHERASAR